MNADHVRKLITKFEELPAQMIDMHGWRGPSCNSAGCIAGWNQVWFHPDTEVSALASNWYDIILARDLGISLANVESIIYLTLWPNTPRQIYDTDPKAAVLVRLRMLLEEAKEEREVR